MLDCQFIPLLIMIWILGVLTGYAVGRMSALKDKGAQ